jgi:cytochrome P450
MAESDSKFDLYGFEFKADPFETYAAMYSDAPIYWHQTMDGRHHAWFVTRYDEAEAILQDYQRFRKFRDEEDQSHQVEPLSEAARALTRHVGTVDPPDHTRLRGLVNQAFTSRMLAHRRDRIQGVADALIDRVQDDGVMEMLNDYAFPLTTRVINEMIGLPATDQERIRRWSDAVIAPQYSHSQFEELMEEFKAYLLEHIEERRSNPQDDLMSRLIQAEMEGDRLSTKELLGMLALLLVAGFETTASFIGNSIFVLLRHPDHWAQLQDDPTLIPAAIEELLRYCGPLERTPRIACEDVAIGGELIRKGDSVLVVAAAANRDPTRFSCPEELDFSRGGMRHLSFGHGIHFCLGAPLARLEAEIALGTVLRRLPTLRFGVPPEQLRWRLPPLVRGLKSLPVAWDRPSAR